MSTIAPRLFLKSLELAMANAWSDLYAHGRGPKISAGRNAALTLLAAAGALTEEERKEMRSWWEASRWQSHSGLAPEDYRAFSVDKLNRLVKRAYDIVGEVNVERAQAQHKALAD